MNAQDMAGNVWEWVADWYDSDYYNTALIINPTGPANGTNKVLRGGAWLSVSDGVRSAKRLIGPPSDHDDNVGFRCAVSAGN